MATITVKNIPDDLYEELRRYAVANHRSINSEVIVCIERAVRARRIDPDAVLTRARQLREATSGYAIGDEEFTSAKQAGRA